MPTLNIAGKRVKVGDEFLKLSAEDQQKTVNEIAAHLSAAPAPQAAATPPAGLVPGSREYADWAAEQARAGKALPQLSKTEPAPDTSLPAQIMAGTSAAANAVPIAGPKLLSALEQGRAAVQHMTPEQVAAETQARETANPTATTVGQVTGTVAPFVLAGTVPVLSTILGMDAAAPLASNIILGGASQKVISLADAAARGETPQQAESDSNIAAAVGGLSPVAGKLIVKGVEAATRPVARLIRGVIAPESTAQKVLSNAVRADAEAGATGLSAADEASAAANGQPLVNADRFGPHVRTLARTASNFDPAAKQTLSDAVHDRFLTQNQRAVDWITRNTGAPTDVHALSQTISDTARKTNKPAYLRAYNDPRAAAVLTVPADPANPAAGDMLAPEIHDLMGAKPMQVAIKKASESAGIDSALHGYGPVDNPFKFNKDGTYAWKPGSKPPSLQFWDHVQRNLARAAKMAGRAGDPQAGSIWALRSKLNDALDAAVPTFNQARTGAAAKFGAEDALDAGQKFLGADISEIPALKIAHAQFSPAEKKLFASGFAASLIDKIGKTGDTTNVINSAFASPRARAQIELALGPKAASDLEHFLRIEDVMHMLKGAVQGGSNTAAQLTAMGALGATGGALSTGDINPLHWLNPSTLSRMGTGAMVMMAGRQGARALGKMVDQKVMQSIATSLASNDPSVIARAVGMASRSPKSAAAIKAIEHGLSLVTRASAMAAVPAAASQTSQMEPAQ